MTISLAGAGLALIHGVLLLAVVVVARALGLDSTLPLILVAIWHGAQAFEAKRELVERLGIENPRLEQMRLEHLEFQLEALEHMSRQDLPDEDETFTPDLARSYIQSLQAVARNTVWAYHQTKRSAANG